MIFTETKLKGCFVIEPKIINDDRGYFMESYNEKTFQNGIGAEVKFVQDNQRSEEHTSELQSRP